MGIKIDEKYDAPWKVMKAASEGKRVVSRPNMRDGRVPEWAECLISTFNWEMYTYAIIDDSQPEIDFDKFDWEFFNQYGGLLAIAESGDKFMIDNLKTRPDMSDALCESIIYPWFGGKQPVPANVMITAVWKRHSRTEQTLPASDVDWACNDLVAFKITGEVE